MKSFNFKGEVSSSKSYYNRALILSAYKKDLQIFGQSTSRDVVFLKSAIQEVKSEMNVGEGGTTLRFLSFLVSRKPGVWSLKGSSRLFSRPQAEIQKILGALGVEVDLKPDSLLISSKI